jgi:hypothetical protein
MVLWQTVKVASGKLRIPPPFVAAEFPDKVVLRMVNVPRFWIPPAKFAEIRLSMIDVVAGEGTPDTPFAIPRPPFPDTVLSTIVTAASTTEIPSNALSDTVVRAMVELPLRAEIPKPELPAKPELPDTVLSKIVAVPEYLMAPTELFETLVRVNVRLPELSIAAAELLKFGRTLPDTTLSVIDTSPPPVL